MEQLVRNNLSGPKRRHFLISVITRPVRKPIFFAFHRKICPPPVCSLYYVTVNAQCNARCLSPSSNVGTCGFRRRFDRAILQPLLLIMRVHVRRQTELYLCHCNVIELRLALIVSQNGSRPVRDYGPGTVWGQGSRPNRHLTIRYRSFPSLSPGKK